MSRNCHHSLLHIKPYRDRLVFNPPINVELGKMTSIYLLNINSDSHLFSFQAHHPHFKIISFIIYCMAVGWRLVRAKKRNQEMHAKNGNNQFRLLHLNKGKSILQNYRATLEHLLSSTSPSLCSLNEANITVGSDLHTKGVMDYKCEAATPPPGSSLSRVCLFIRRP